MLDKKMLIEMQDYIQTHLNRLTLNVSEAFNEAENFSCKGMDASELEVFIKTNRKPTMNQLLFSIIDKKGMSDSEIYKRAGIDRRHFSKIRSNPNYHPGKNTTIALALALELSKEDTEKLLNSAGYSFSDSETYDLIIQFFLEKKRYDIDLVNQALDYFSLKPLSGSVQQ